MGEVGKPRGTREGLLSPAALGEGNHLLMPSSETCAQKEEVSHVFRSTVAAQPGGAAGSDCPLLPNRLLREAEFLARVVSWQQQTHTNRFSLNRQNDAFLRDGTE